MKKKSKSKLHSHVKHKAHKPVPKRRLSLEKTELPKVVHKKSKKKHMVVVGVLMALILISVGVLLFLGVIPMEMASKDAAIVNDEKISLEEINTGYNRLDDSLKAQISKEQFLEQTIIPQKLMLQEAKKQGHQVTQEELDKEMEFFMKNAGMDEAQLNEKLAESGVNKDELVEAMENRILLMKYMNKQLEGIAVTEEEIVGFYQQNQAQIVAQYGEQGTIQQLAPLIQQQLLAQKQQNAVISMVTELKNNANININKEVLKE